MHLPIAHISGFEEELQAQLRATHSAGSQEDDQGSQNSQSQGSGKDHGGLSAAGDGSGAAGEAAAGGTRPPKDLPCPRCQSMNTKFCYYNNYSVNQPRHFCRNCQRYWTVGGTLRNVPVGGGSRKSKSSRSRARADPYYRPNAPAAREDFTPDDDAAAAAAAPRHSQPPDAGFPSQISTLLQFLAQPSPFPSPFLDPPAPGFAMTADEEAELHAFYEAACQPGAMSAAAAMLGSGLWVPELELMQKAALWAEAQRLQSLARRAQAVAWVDPERECKPVVSSPPVLQQRAPVDEHRRPGFWETALMHSRPSRRPAGASQTSASSPWDETKPNTVPEEEGAYSLAGYDVESSSWAPSSALDSSNPEMYY